MSKDKPVYLYDNDKWMLAEEIRDIFFYFCHTWSWSFANVLENSCGRNYKKVLGIFKGTDMSFYYGEEDSAKFEKYLVDKIEKDPKFGRDINTNIYKYSDELYKFANKLANTNLVEVTNDKIALLIIQEFKIHTGLYEWGWLSNATDMFHATFTNRLKDKLKMYVNDDETINNYLNILSTPRKNSVITEQELEFLNIIAGIQNRDQKVRVVTKSNLQNEELHLIEGYRAKYHHVKYLWVGTKGTYTIRDYIEQINEFLSKNLNASDEIKRINIELIKKQKEKERLENKLKLSSELNSLIAVYSEFMLTKAYRREAQLKWSYEFNKLLIEIARRLKISLGQAYFLLPKEIENALITGKIDRDILKEREKFSVYYTEKDFEKIYTGKEALELSKQVAIKSYDGVSEITGQCANVGHVSGVVKIINTISDMPKMQQGDILVAITTNPDILPAMKKAAAFVTEQGGITSHAAIVARELGTPCIIGTKIAAKVLKDGDYVDVDATKGIVRKIKREDMKQTAKKQLQVIAPIKLEKPVVKTRPELILWFKDLSKTDIPTVGGKGANLGEMFNHFPIPNGFCITVNSYKRFLEETGLDKAIYGMLDTLNVNDNDQLEKVSKKIRNMILEKPFPKDMERLIKENYSKLKNKKVAVRSSATAEDLPTASFAGQQDTYLNIKGEKAVFDAVQRCWASLFTSRAIYYREENNFEHRDVLISVVVQEMIDADYAGVMFTVDPVNRKYILIEAVEGLGEALVSGQVTPNSYFVHKTDEKVMEKTEHFAFDEGLIHRIAELGRKIETHYKCPMDIEYATKDDKIYILQARPITTLGESLADSRVLYRKLMSRSMFLLACQIWDTGERIRMPELLNGAYSFDPLFSHREGMGIDIYYNFTDPKQAPSNLIEYLTSNKYFFRDQKRIFDSKCNQIRKLVKSGTKNDFKILYNLMIDVWPLIAISTVIVNEENIKVDKNLNLLSHAVRKESDGVLHWGVEKLFEFAVDIVPSAYKGLVGYLKYNEINSQKLPKISELVKRRKSYVYHNGKLYSGDTLTKYSKENRIDIEGYIGEEKTGYKGYINGETAFKGKIKGRVALVFERTDVGKVKKGDILVTPMTTPNLIVAMQKAAAFVTDEGGITCHAAIVARELKKPCIIATKIATKVLKDGDLVEVDANNSIIRILKN